MTDIWVRIAPYEELLARYNGNRNNQYPFKTGTVHFPSEMREYCGKIYKKGKQVDSHRGYYLEGAGSYTWHAEWFEELDLEIGATYEVINIGKMFSSYASMAKLLKADKWNQGSRSISTGDCGKLIAFHKHETQDSKMCCLIEIESKQVIVGIDGLKKVTSTPKSDIWGGPATGLKTETKTTKKEKGEEPMSKNVLEQIASADLNKELIAAGAAGLPAGIREALEKQIKEEQEEASKKAARRIMDVLKAHDSNIDANVTELRRLRKAEEAQRAQMEKLNRAKAYGMETQNFIPLAILTGNMQSCQVEDQTLCEVPKDWKPAGEADKKPGKK